MILRAKLRWSQYKRYLQIPTCNLQIGCSWLGPENFIKNYKITKIYLEYRLIGDLRGLLDQDLQKIKKNCCMFQTAHYVANRHVSLWFLSFVYSHLKIMVNRARIILPWITTQRFPSRTSRSGPTSLSKKIYGTWILLFAKHFHKEITMGAIWALNEICYLCHS